jgi:hypothetical protein
MSLPPLTVEEVVDYPAYAEPWSPGWTEPEDPVTEEIPVITGSRREGTIHEVLDIFWILLWTAIAMILLMSAMASV